MPLTFASTIASCLLFNVVAVVVVIVVVAAAVAVTVAVAGNYEC